MMTRRRERGKRWACKTRRPTIHMNAIERISEGPFQASTGAGARDPGTDLGDPAFRSGSLDLGQGDSLFQGDLPRQRARKHFFPIPTRLTFLGALHLFDLAAAPVFTFVRRGT